MISEISNPLADQIATLKGLVSKLSANDANFAGSLVKQFSMKGSLSEKQIPWVEKLIAKATPVPHSPTAPKPALPFAPGAYEAFLSAVPPSTLKPAVVLAIREDENDKQDRRAVRLAKVPGKLYLKLQYRADFQYGEWLYAGALRPDGSISYASDTQFMKGFDRVEVAGLLELFAEDVAEVLAKTGIFFGICANCGRTLTHPVSVHIGVGPICVSLFPSLAKTYTSAMALFNAGKDFK